MSADLSPPSGPFIPLHDAIVFEAPLEAFEEVTNLTAKVMRATLREVFPELKPRVTVNISKPTCWNKDGKTRGNYIYDHLLVFFSHPV